MMAAWEPLSQAETGGRRPFLPLSDTPGCWLAVGGSEQRKSRGCKMGRHSGQACGPRPGFKSPCYPDKLPRLCKMGKSTRLRGLILPSAWP